MQRYGFNITIQVSDHGRDTSNKYHIDYSKVVIGLIDINDNPPEFEDPLLKASVDENVTVGYVVKRFQARDPDQAGKSMVRYENVYFSFLFSVTSCLVSSLYLSSTRKTVKFKLYK